MQLNIFRKSYWRRRSNSHVLRQIRQSTDYFFTVSYRKNMRSELSRLCQKYGTDKGAINLDDHPKREGRIHNYADFYEMVFGGMRRHVKAVLECGIGQYSRGGSLRAWREYFPNAIITGVDIDEAILFDEERIETYQVDQTSPASIKQFLEKVKDRKFDIIIDDGLHTAEAGIVFFDNTIERLADDGIYIIEDVKLPDMLVIAKHLERYGADYDVRLVNLDRPGKSISDNSLVMVTKNRPA